MPKIEIAHPYIESLTPYKAPDLEAAAARAGMDQSDLIRLDANENALGPAPPIIEAVAKYPDYAFYPDYGPLRRAIARYADVKPAQVVLANGADELIDLLIRLFVEPGQAVVTCPPTFSMYRIFARVNRCQVLPVDRRADFSIDVESVENAVRQAGDRARLLFLISPGNPDGRAIPFSTVHRLLKLPLMVAVDEAYIEFGGQSAAPLLSEYSNLVILRTFSKWAGLAGLRLGYGLLEPCYVDYLERIRAPYNVNAAAVAAGLAALEHQEATRATVERVIAQREQLQKALEKLTLLEPLPSQANFILCRVPEREPQDVVDALARRGILIRSFSDPALARYVRIGVGRPEQNDDLLTALREIQEEANQ